MNRCVVTLLSVNAPAVQRRASSANLPTYRPSSPLLPLQGYWMRGNAINAGLSTAAAFLTFSGVSGQRQRWPPSRTRTGFPSVSQNPYETRSPPPEQRKSRPPPTTALRLVRLVPANRAWVLDSPQAWCAFVILQSSSLDSLLQSRLNWQNPLKSTRLHLTCAWETCIQLTITPASMHGDRCLTGNSPAPFQSACFLVTMTRTAIAAAWAILCIHVSCSTRNSKKTTAFDGERTSFFNKQNECGETTTCSDDWVTRNNSFGFPKVLIECIANIDFLCCHFEKRTWIRYWTWIRIFCNSASILILLFWLFAWNYVMMTAYVPIFICKIIMLFWIKEARNGNTRISYPV